jgi:zinc-ribbon domain
MGILIFAALIGLIPAGIASRKGRSFAGWWVYGALLFIVALIHSLMLRPDAKLIDAKDLKKGDLKKCPNCAELVKQEAKTCRYCGQSFEPVSGPSTVS